VRLHNGVIRTNTDLDCVHSTQNFTCFPSNVDDFDLVTEGKIISKPLTVSSTDLVVEIVLKEDRSTPHQPLQSFVYGS
jgi:hypothetical protein